jgi:Tfp pilus assembly protein PilO
MTYDDFRRLNFREVGTWPWLPKVIVLLLVMLFIVGLGAFFDWKDQWEALGAAEQDEVKLKEQYTQKKAKAINYDLYVQQLAEVEQSFGALVKQLPNRSEIDALLTDINQAGLGRGLQFDLFRPAPQERDGRLLRRAADQHQDHRQLPRHRCVRERRRGAAADRDAERRCHLERQGHAQHGRRREDVPLSR